MYCIVTTTITAEDKSTYFCRTYSCSSRRILSRSWTWSSTAHTDIHWINGRFPAEPELSGCASNPERWLLQNSCMARCHSWHYTGCSQAGLRHLLTTNQLTREEASLQPRTLMQHRMQQFYFICSYEHAVCLIKYIRSLCLEGGLIRAPVTDSMQIMWQYGDGVANTNEDNSSVWTH